MEKTRVPYGEKFWFIRTDGRINYGLEYEDLYCKDFFDCGNYFHTKEEAESMARKIRAVLKGADVIEMPSEEEMESNADKQIHNYSPMPDSVDYNGGFWDAINFLKSKIVK